jgi:hypothetical protein
MKHRILAVVVGLAVVPAMSGTASAHRSGCHGAHSCPSDHATYRWHGRLCVKPAAEERTSAFDRKVRYAGLTYYCR